MNNNDTLSGFVRTLNLLGHGKDKLPLKEKSKDKHKKKDWSKDRELKRGWE